MSVPAMCLAGQFVRAAAAAFGIILSAMAGAEARTPFYQASEQEIAGPPRTLIRQEPMFGAPDGAAALRAGD
jgi:hypothetical protein